MVAPSFSFSRRDERRVLAGVAGGFADQHGVDVAVVRAALVVLSLAGGLGVVLYAVGHLLSAAPGSAVSPPHPADQRRNVSVAAITLGALLIMRGAGLWLGDAAMAPIVVLVAGGALLSVLRPNALPQAWSADPGSPIADVVGGRHARERIIGGAALISIGLVLVGLNRGVSSSLRFGVFATASTIIGIALLLGPWFARVAQQASSERRQRIRLDEREAMAAHLHDSVLQTLALIQRSADDPRRTIALARRQESELREWLYGTATASDATVVAAIRTMVREVEDLYDVRIDVVAVGDGALTNESVAVIAAAREACVNAAKHSGVDDVSVFVETTVDTVEVFVRDRGCGFDTAAPRAEGRGITQSIEARLERVGGRAEVESSAGNGTEVHLTAPRRVAAHQDTSS